MEICSNYWPARILTCNLFRPRSSSACKEKVRLAAGRLLTFPAPRVEHLALGQNCLLPRENRDVGARSWSPWMTQCVVLWSPWFVRRLMTARYWALMDLHLQLQAILLRRGGASFGFAQRPHIKRAMLRWRWSELRTAFFTFAKVSHPNATSFSAVAVKNLNNTDVLLAAMTELFLLMSPVSKVIGCHGTERSHSNAIKKVLFCEQFESSALRARHQRSPRTRKRTQGTNEGTAPVSGICRLSCWSGTRSTQLVQSRAEKSGALAKALDHLAGGRVDRTESGRWTLEECISARIDAGDVVNPSPPSTNNVPQLEPSRYETRSMP